MSGRWRAAPCGLHMFLVRVITCDVCSSVKEAVREEIHADNATRYRRAARKTKQVMKGRERPKPKRRAFTKAVSCGVCGRSGHNRRTCNG